MITRRNYYTKMLICLYVRYCDFVRSVLSDYILIYNLFLMACDPYNKMDSKFYVRKNFATNCITIPI